MERLTRHQEESRIKKKNGKVPDKRVMSQHKLLWYQRQGVERTESERQKDKERRRCAKESEVRKKDRREKERKSIFQQHDHSSRCQ